MSLSESRGAASVVRGTGSGSGVCSRLAAPHPTPKIRWRWPVRPPLRVLQRNLSAECLQRPEVVTNTDIYENQA